MTASLTALYPQGANPGQEFSFTLPSGLFTAPQGASLTYSASELDGSALPSWVSFNPATQTLSGLMPTSEPARLVVTINATANGVLLGTTPVLVSATSNPLIGGDLSGYVSQASATHLPGTPTTVTYSFETAVPTDPFPIYGTIANFRPLTAAEQTVVQQAMSMYASVANVNFIQMADSPSSNLRFGTTYSTNFGGLTVFDPSGTTDQAQIYNNQLNT